jgi:hypothetical protein
MSPQFIRQSYRRRCLAIAITLGALAVLVLALCGCVDLHFPRGTYAVHEHVLVIASRADVDSEYRARHQLYCGNREDGSCAMVAGSVHGFWDATRNEIWCAPEMGGDCYGHELKHLLQLWDYRHRDLH